MPAMPKSINIHVVGSGTAATCEITSVLRGVVNVPVAKVGVESAPVNNDGPVVEALTRFGPKTVPST